MLLNDIGHATSHIEADAARTASWARQYETAIAARRGHGPRSVIGNALINLGRFIAAEPTQARTQLRVGR
jgi:hypothetical protein